MAKKQRGFHSRVVTINYSLWRQTGWILILLFLTILLFGSNVPLPQLPTGFFLAGMKHTIIGLHSGETIAFRYSGYDVLANSILSIQASEVMSKKYAAMYGGVLKHEKPAQEGTEQMDVLINNVLETDISAKGLTFINTPGYSVDAQTLLNTPLNFSSPYNGPRVLIVHTHTSEAYAESPGARSENPTQNVVNVGAEIASVLRSNGIQTVHDTTQNDNPSYNQSYKKALTVIEKNLTAYPTLEVVLDIHRDYIKQDDGTLVKPTVTTIDGKKIAQIMFVIGTDNMGLYHPNWRHNLGFAVKIQHRLGQIQPGLCRAINIRTERFNQHATKGSMIIEVGTGVNTVEESKAAATLLGQAIADVLKEYA
ncbi:MAG: hypothetical protein E7393_01085 [Ruminococcaceae bacterium]|nr:hypothetical protein [Oscillospiraceae bacterium]